MIVITKHQLVVGKYLFRRKLVEKFPNETDFGFNIGDAVQWLEYLRKRQDISLKSKEGFDICYRVYIMGSLKGTKAKDVGGVTVLFPGFDPKTGQKLDLVKYGRLDQNLEYWKKRKMEQSNDKSNL